MSDHLDRYRALLASLRTETLRPGKEAAPFAAAALLAGEGDPGALAGRTRKTHRTLAAALGGCRAPTGSMRWVHAAILAAQDVDARTFLDMRRQLNAERERAKIGLHAGGSRAALVLCVSGEPTVEAVRRFFPMKRALQPPWWRRNGAITDTFAAAHAAVGGDPRTVLAARETAETVFAAHPKAKGHRREGARLCALLDADPAEILARFLRIEAARRADGYLKRRSDRSLAMDWAAQGLDEGDIAGLVETMRTLPKPAPGIGHGRARLARLILTGGAGAGPAGAASALSAVLAAQAAVIAASAAAASTAATSAAGS